MKNKFYHIGLIGYFAVGKSKAGGQEAKTCAIAKALQKYYLRTDLRKIDTGNWKKRPVSFLLKILYLIRYCKNIIMFPAQNSVKIFAPLFVIFGKALKRKLYYVVIGGWLPEMTKEKKWLSFFLKKFDGIYVETKSMKFVLEKQGFDNIFVMPNFKNLQILKEKDLVYTTKAPFPFCMFARVTKEKGVEDAIDAITKLNNSAGCILATLDIYGKINDNYKNYFENLQKTFPNYIKYKGVASPTESVNILKKYFALLFPTHYATEGIPGTIIDAYSAGIPIITSLWNNSRDIFKEKVTGLGFELGNKEEFFNCIKQAIDNYEKFNLMKILCLKEAQKYTSTNAINILVNSLGKSNL